VIVTKTLRVFSWLAVFAAFAVFAVEYESVLGAIMHADLQSFLAMMLCSCFVSVSAAMILQMQLQAFDIRLSLGECLKATVMSSLGNLLLPMQGGMSLRAVYLKKTAKLPYSRFVSTVFAVYLINFQLLAAIGLLSYAALYVSGEVYNHLIPMFFGVFFIGTSVAIFFGLPMPLKALHRIWEGWQIMRRGKVLYSLYALLLLNILVMSLATAFAFRSVDAGMGFMQAMMVSVMSFFALFVNLTPANLGIREMVISYTTSMVGGGVVEGFAASVVLRAAELSSLFLVFVAQLAFFKPWREYKVPHDR
jgi:uncharacterized membrane protein YbhN (UPF0104 family)